MSNKALLDWAQKQPAWARDALRRIASSPDLSLPAEERAAILQRVRHVATNTGGGPECVPLTDEHLHPLGDAGPRTVLAALGPVENIDRLAPEQQLRFAEHGVTLVFGENGSGKSGYTRIAKHLCRSLSNDALKGNVFDASGAKPMRARVRFRVGDAEISSLDWSPGNPPPRALRAVSVFDSQNAGLYVDAQNQIAYLPFELALLEQHGRVCTDLAAVVSAEEKPIRQRLNLGPPAGYAADGGCQTLIARMTPDGANLPSDEEATRLATLAEAETTELAELEQRLAQDPGAQAAVRRRAGGLLQRVLEHVSRLDAGLSPAAEAAFDDLIQTLASAETAVLLSAEDAFTGDPLKGVGGETWRLLYVAARDFAAQTTLEREALPETGGAPCPLCQDPLSETGADRFKRFNAFIRSEASQRADAARTALESARTVFGALAMPDVQIVSDSLATFADLGDEQHALMKKIIGALTAHAARRTALAVRTAATVETTPPPAENLQQALGAMLERLSNEAEVLEKSAGHDGALDAQRRRLSELRDRKKLGEDLPVLLQRLTDLRELAILRACLTQLGTGSITRQTTILRRALVTEDLQRRIAEEIDALDLSHIPLKVSDGAAQGQNHFALGLEGVQRIKNSRILSEGEQRALALACFLAELGDQGSGILVDDPVTSLDHHRMRKVAARLVAEAAKGRQVIVFTHNLVFFNEVAAEAARLGEAAPLMKIMVRKTEADGFGVIAEDTDPWLARSITMRITDLRERLRTLNGHDDPTGEGYRRLAKDFYSDLRESWERAVEEVVLGKTIQRLVPDVMTQRLRGVEVGDDDYATIFHAMKRASERSGHDMPEGRAIAAPSPGEMAADVETLDQFRQTLNTRRKIVEARRLLREGPVRAVLAE